MINKPLLATLLAGSALALASCDKSSTTPDAAGTAQTVTAELTKNSTYTYTLPSGSGATYRVITPSEAGADVDINTVQNTATFAYTPAPDFVGADVVAVVATSTEASSGAGCNGGGNSRGGVSQSDTLTFRLQVTEVATGS